MDLEGWMDINPLEHIHEIDARLNALQPTRGDEALHSLNNFFSCEGEGRNASR